MFLRFQVRGEPEIRQDGVDCGVLCNAEQAETAERLEGYSRRSRIVHLKKAANDRFPVVADASGIQRLSRSGSLSDMAPPVEHDRVQRFLHRPGESRSDHRFEQQVRQLYVAAGRFDDGANVVLELGTQQTGCGMAAPVLGPEKRIVFGQPLQGGQQGSRLVKAQGLGVAIAEDGIRIGFDAASGQRLIEMRQPRVQPTQGRRHPFALAKQCEDSLLGDASFEAPGEPPGA